jgi:hypothetical protein
MRAWSVAILLAGCSSRPDPAAGCIARSGQLVSFTGGTSNAAFVGAMLYFDSNDVQRIARVPVGGGAIETLVEADATGEWAAGGDVFAWETEPVHATPESPTYVDQLHIRDPAGVVHDLAPMTNGGVTLLHATSGGDVYWLDAAGVERWDHATAEPALIAQASIGLVDDTRLYWIDQTSIRSIAVTGGEVQTVATLSLASGTTLSLGTLDADNLYLVETPPADGTSLGGFYGRRIVSIPRSGGVPSLIADNVDSSFANLAVDDHHVYWATPPPGTGDYISEIDIQRADKRGGGPVEPIAKLKSFVAAIGVDACNVYAVTNAGLSAYPKP